jgi:putative FmdB family regulatory protein
MPLYEYQCTQCGERVEIIQRHSDPPPAHCAKCNGDMKKLVSAPAIQFKGSGWYKTDYASKPAASSSSSSSESKSDTKSETKSDTAASTTTTTKSETKSGD